MTHPRHPGTPVPIDPDPLGRLLGVLTLEPGQHGYDARAGNLAQPGGRVYGGQVLAQSLLLAGRSVPEGRLPHSMHGYFLRPGAVSEPIDFALEDLHDGRSFSARRVHALQGGQPILSMIASFQEVQEGIEVAGAMPDAPEPEEVPSAMDELGYLDNPVAQFWSHHAAFDLRHVGGSLYLGPGATRAGDLHADRQLVWMRARGPVADDKLLHRALMAYACDQVMLEPILRGSGRSWSTRGMAIASLDHAMWWHRDARVDDWLLYVQSAASAQGGRGLGTARVFSRDGTLVASIAQEGMIRAPEQ